MYMKYLTILTVGILLMQGMQSIHAQTVQNLPSPPTTIRKNHAPVNVLSQIPEYPGGEDALNLYIRANLHKSVIYYYTKKRPSDIRRPTIVSFIVRTDGSLSNIKIKQCPANGWGERYDKMIMTLIKNMPHWNPGLDQNGNPRSCRYTLRIEESTLFDFPAQTVYSDLRDEWCANP